MKFSCGETFHEKKWRLKHPHLWFAWHPVRVCDADGPGHHCVWLETVWRNGWLEPSGFYGMPDWRYAYYLNKPELDE